MGHEKRLSTETGELTLPSTEFVLGRLDQIDIRLRQLEEKQKLPESYFAADLRRPNHFMSLSSALHEAHVKGTLMERLQLLETRIRQLSYELDRGSGAGPSSSSTTAQTSDMGWLQPIAPEMPAMKEKHEGIALCSSMVVEGPRRTSEVLHIGTRQLQVHKSSKKDSKEAMDAMEKRASAMCRNEKRRMERTRIYRKWFPVGC